MPSSGQADRGTRALQGIYQETWAILELHFLTRPHLADRARQELVQCIDELMAEGRGNPALLKNLACRAIQLKFGPAPAHAE